MHQFLDGVLMTEFLVVALVFVRFWRQSRDRLFLLFALSFAIMAVNRGLILATREWRPSNEDQTALYLVRLAAFVLILVAVLDKNRAPAADAAGPRLDR